MNPRHGSLCFIKNRIRRFTTGGKPAWPRVFDLPSDWVYPRLRQALREGIYQKVSTAGQEASGENLPREAKSARGHPGRVIKIPAREFVDQEETKAPNSRLLTLVSIGLTPVGVVSFLSGVSCRAPQ